MEDEPLPPAFDQGVASIKKPICRFYNSKHGCRTGDQCKFQHVPKQETSGTVQAISTEIPASSTQRQPTASTMTSRPTPVARPTPKAQTDDPRAFQLAQIQRRYKPQVSENQNGNTSLKFQMQPSDPDFPYEIEALECTLNVPVTYPASGKPTLLIGNADIPRGFQINIERGFDVIAADSSNVTLLGLINKLDRQLESILSGKKADTIKIVANQDKEKKAVVPEVEKPSAKQIEEISPTRDKSFSDEELTAAQTKRQSHVRHLEARFSRLDRFSKSSDGLSYIIPLDSPKRSTWPANLQSLRSVQLLVPHLYPLEPAEILFDHEGTESSTIGAAFKARSTQDSNASLTQQINYLSQNLKEMSVSKSDSPEEPAVQTVATAAIDHSNKNAPIDDPKPVSTLTESHTQDAHIHYIPRPPEWIPRDKSDSSDDSDSLSDTEDEENFTGEDDKATEGAGQSAPAERGILLSLPHLELHGIELLELVSLNITVKCERCKDTMDVSRLRSNGENSEMRVESCKKCAAGLAVRFRADLIHANAVRAGYLDLEACTVVDMLPSSFVPTCAECSTAVPAPGVVGVRGDSVMAVCRECHKKLSFRISEVKFLHISPSAARASLAPGRKKARENLGITAGTELPQRGRCQHYKKSYRWFRFSCCSHVFACDKCHDEKTDHPNEWANRMLCGFCSREQNFRPEDCGICHASLTGKRGRGFWEGGKGTRDPMRMSRKDPRKYKRKPGSKSKK